MGDKQNIQFITERLTQASVNDDFVYEVVPDLIYTRQPEIFEYLEQIILSNAQNCSSANPDAETNILCGYRVMEYLAPVIEDFPLPTDEYGELMVDDYPEALEELRNWLVDQDYAIDTDTF
jgi:hypothetical protein